MCVIFVIAFVFLSKQQKEKKSQNQITSVFCTKSHKQLLFKPYFNRN